MLFVAPSIYTALFIADGVFMLIDTISNINKFNLEDLVAIQAIAFLHFAKHYVPHIVV